MIRSIIQDSQRRLTVVAFIFVLTLDVLICLYLAGQIGDVAHLPFATDEAVHANGGLELALDLSAGDIGGFFSSVYNQAYYPPTQSLLLTPAFLVFGTSETVARMVSLACLFVIVLLLYALGLELHERHGWLIGLVAALFAFTAQPLLTISAMVMQEPVGLMFTLIAVWLYMRGIKRSTNQRVTSRYFFAASLTLVAVMLSKYLFGVYLLTTFVVARLIESRLSLRRLLTRSNVALFVPFAIIMALWFIDPVKQHDFWRYAGVPSLQADAFSIEHLTFYWRSIVVNYTSAPLPGVLLLAGIVYGLYRWRDALMLVLTLHILIAIAGMTLRRTINPRFIYVAAPLIYLLAGALLVRLFEASRQLKQRWPQRPWRAIDLAALGAGAFVMLVAVAPGVSDRYASYAAMLQVRIKTDPREFAAFDWIAQSIPPDRRNILMVNYWDQFSAEGLRWYLLSRDTTPGRRFEDVQIVPRFASPVGPESTVDFLAGLSSLGVTEVVGFAGGPEGNSGTWIDSQPAIGEALDFVDHASFDMAKWDRTLLLQLRDNGFSDLDALNEALQKYNYGYHVAATIYRVRD